MKWEVVIGLEIHVQLKTNSKLFCRCSTKFSHEANSNICSVCIGMPGVLPVLNKQAVENAIKLGLATNCTINKVNEFARKNYFYPDLPKGYQISQFDKPICLKGNLEVSTDDGTKAVGITRIHIEEDAGKLVHQGSDNIKGATSSLSDLNRSSVPLLEIVSEPDIRSAKQAKAYMEKIHQIIRYLDISDGNMEEGSMRCDANISIRKKGDPKLGTRTEVKNLNSFKAIERAINIEVERQIDILEDGGTIVQETRHYNEATNSTKSLRSKEEAHDYRYFPDPDLVPLNISDKWIENIKKSMPELPSTLKKRYLTDYGLNDYDAELMTLDLFTANLFEETSKLSGKPKEVANWLMGDITKYLNANNLELKQTKITPQNLTKIIESIDNKTISRKIAKQIIPDILEKDIDPKIIVKEKGLTQITETGAIEKTIREVLDENPKAVQDIKDGKQQTIGFLIGQVMKKTSGKANPQIVRETIINLTS